MPTVNDVLRIKGQRVFSITPAATVLDAVKEMNSNRIGALLVMDKGVLVGIFTERDILTRVVATERNSVDLKVAEVMTSDVYCCGLQADLDNISEIMRSKRIRHIPVLDADSKVVSIISIGDVNAFNISQKQATIENLSDYICGRS